MKTTHLKLIIAIILICQAITAIAVPAFPGLASVKQPDGYMVSLYLKGDEKVHWMESEDGYSLLFNNKKAIVYAITDEKGDMMPSSVIARDINMRSSHDNAFLKNIQKKLRFSSNQINTLRSIWEITSQSSAVGSNQFRAAVGDANAICTLINFPDKPLIKSKADFEVLMNQEGYSANGAMGSVVDFYKENSYGKLDFKITVAGPYTLSKNWGYYGENNLSTGNDYIERVQEFAREAANLTFKDPEINPADYDNDNDGFIDSFHIIFAGFGEEVSGSDPNCIWSHKFEFPPISFGNKKVNVYSCSPELRGNSGTNITNIGVICHELCHVFGAPDFYDVDGDSGGEFIGTGNWDLMANGSWNNSGICPAHVNMYQKIKFGWVDPEILTDPKEITNMPNSAENAMAYRYDTSTSGEYFVLENRQKRRFDSYVPGTGLLIYHVSNMTDVAINNNTVNNRHPQKMYPVCASANTNPTGTPVSYGSINSAGCTFGGYSGKTSFTDYTVPSATSWNKVNTFKSLTEIKEQSGNISFRFMMPDAEPVTNLQVKVENQNVNITWNKPSDDITGYNIYRNNTLLIKLMGKDNTYYSQMNVNSGNYSYCVNALYADKESAPVCKEVKVNSQNDGSYLSIKDLQAKSINDGMDIELKWQSPFVSDWIGHAKDLTNFLYFENVNQFTSTTRYTVEDLRYFYGSKLTKVRFGVNTTLCKYTIKVWIEDANKMNPLTPVITQTVNNPSLGINDITLENPIPLENNKELWIGIEYNMDDITFVAGFEKGTTKSFRNWVFFDKWYYLDDDQNRNWFISGYMQFDNNILKAHADDSWLRSTTATATQYVIYRDSKVIATTTQPSYVDPKPSNGSHIYCVSIAYNDGKESEPVCIEAFSSNIISIDPVTNLLLSVENRNVKLTWDKPSEYVTAYNIYCNDMLLETIMGKDNTTYTQYNVNQGEYTYYVTAVYDKKESEPVYVDVVIFDPKPVTNLHVNAENQNVKLNWDKPSDDVTAYNIYRNDILLITLWGKNNTAYNQINVNCGSHNYCVTAIYNNSESIPVCKEVQVNSQIYETYQSVQNLEAQNINNDKDIELNWESPFVSDWITFAKEILGWRDYRDVDKFVSVVRFTTNDLRRYQGSKLTKVRFSIYNLECKYTIQVWLTDKGYEPSDSPIVNQLVNNPASTDNFFEVTLNTPIDLEINKELWIGIQYELNPMTAVAGTDNGPKVSGRNYYYINGQLNETSSNDDFNWFISGYMQFDDNLLNATADNWLRAITTVPTNYVIFRDGDIIATTTQVSYVDPEPSYGSHIYCVSIAYDDGKESEPVCIEAFSTNITSVVTVNQEEKIEIYPNPIQKGEFLVIRFDSQIVSTISLFNTSGQLLQQEQITGGNVYKKMDFEPGIYLLQIKNNSNTLIRKIIIK